MIASVIVDVKNCFVNHAFDYEIPDSLSEIEKGFRVIVPFGAREVLGFVIDIKEKSDFSHLKQVLKTLDVIPSLSDEMLSICLKMARETSSFIASSIETALPNALLTKASKKYVIINPTSLPFPAKKGDILDEIDLSIPVLKEKIKEGTIEVFYEIKEKGSIQESTMVALNKLELEGLTVKQSEVVDYLLKNGETLKRTLQEETSKGALDTLIKKGIVRIYKEENYRKLSSIAPYIYKKVELNLEQKSAYQEIVAALSRNEVFLLHGVTGSGKTEVYLEVIEDVLKQGKDSILLVPEISLTPQMVNRLKGRFQENVAVFHSGLSMNERYDEWRRVNRGEAHIVVGARSAIFTPLKNIGIIFIDEAHEGSYQQDTSPRYNAKEIAFLRGEYHNCPIVLGSATPSVCDYYLAQKGTYHLLEIKKRANQREMPKTINVDMKKELENGNKSPFSRTLRELIQSRLTKQEQTILLINKRGHSSFVMCRSCGETITCPKCDVTLTYHETGDYLKCHYCGYQTKNVKVCPACGSKYIKYVGIGTEQVVDLLEKEFPSARVLRMDQDTTTKKGSHEKILYEFGCHHADILVGTQMIAKGLDFPLVTLVGILLADLMLKLPDYRQSERTFELINQVAGRCGRHEKEGVVVVQSYNSSHYSIEYASQNNYLGFYQKEIMNRKIGHVAPFYQTVLLIFSSKKKDLANDEAFKCSKMFPIGAIVLGPTVPLISRINDFYRIQLTVKYQGNMDDLLCTLNEKYNASMDVLISIERQK